MIRCITGITITGEAKERLIVSLVVRLHLALNIDTDEMPLSLVMPNVLTNFYLSAQMLLDDAKNYTFMTAGGLRVPGIDDVEEFTSTQNSMKVMGISDEDMTSIWRVISSCLLFGNMEFKQERSNDQATLPDNTVAQKVAHLLGIQVTDLTKAFLKPRIKGRLCWW